MTAAPAGAAGPGTVVAGIGGSAADDSREAGRRAATQAVGQLDGAQAALVLVLASPSHDLPALLAAVRGVVDAPTVGATTCGQFHDGTFVAPGGGVTVVALTAGPYRFGVASVSGVGEEPATAEDAGARLAADARAAVGGRRPFAALLLLAIGVGGDLESLLRGIHRVAGAAVPVVGGAASDDRLLSQTSVFHDDLVLVDGAVAVWIDAPAPVTVVAKHGWTSVSEPMMVTRTQGPVVHELAGRRAVEVFLEYARAGAGPADDGGWALGARPAPHRPGDPPPDWHASHALGLVQPDGGHLVRGCFVDDADELRAFAPLPEYGAVEVLSSTPHDLLAVTSDVVASALDGRPAGLLLAFSCVARLDILGERVPEEAALLQRAAGPARTCGFYTYGEFARTVGAGGFHNATVAAVAL